MMQIMDTRLIPEIMEDEEVQGMEALPQIRA
jgi:hypothetical protein